MDWYPLYNSLRIAAISTVAVFFLGILAVLAGHAAGKRLAERCPSDLSWIGGLLLILLAIGRL